ncbi:MAG: DUF4397 domain-containing protein [Arcticibacter sp.]
MKLFHLLPKKSKFFSMSLALLASATLFTSCLKNDGDDGIDQPISGLSFVHAAASQSAVGIYVDGRILFQSAVQYGGASQYLSAVSGNHLVQTTIGGTVQKLSEATIALAEGKYYTVFVADRQPVGDSLTTVMIQDAIDVKPTEGKAKVRFVQLSPGAEEYDLYIQGGQKLFDSKAYKESSDFMEINPAKYKFAIRLAAGAEDKAVSDEVNVEAGKFYTIVVGGSAAGTGNKGLKVFPVLAR